MLLDSISIHSPRVGRDTIKFEYGILKSNFNPLSPCGERHITIVLSISASLFQSTLPVWGETAKLTKISRL